MKTPDYVIKEYHDFARVRPGTDLFASGVPLDLIFMRELAAVSEFLEKILRNRGFCPQHQCRSSRYGSARPASGEVLSLPGFFVVVFPLVQSASLKN